MKGQTSGGKETARKNNIEGRQNTRIKKSTKMKEKKNQFRSAAVAWMYKR